MKRRYIFIDGGSHRGQSIRCFERSAIFSQYPWEIFAFEPNSALNSFVPHRPYLTILNKAIWIHDGTLDFYLGKETDGSSVLSCKRVGGLSKVPVEVDCIDFGQWIRRNFSQYDYVLVKLNVEGAEYQVLEQMLGDGTISYIDALFVSFHNRMVKIHVQRDIELMEKLRNSNILSWESIPHRRFPKSLKDAIINGELKGLDKEEIE